jgi:SAM-dependent methyltransferase
MRTSRQPRSVGTLAAVPEPSLASRARRTLKLVRRRLRPGPPPTDNVAYNRKVWDEYARDWDDPDVRVAGADVRSDTPLDAQSLTVVGQEWGLPAEVEEVVGEWILPYVDSKSMVAEIGVGGGRVALLVAPKVSRFIGLDIAPEMLRRAREALHAQNNYDLKLLGTANLPAELQNLDFIYSFDVMVHTDVHTIWAYVKDFTRVLKPGGHAFIHTSNLTTEEGWKLFSSQERYYPEGFFWLTPQTVKTLAERGGLEVVSEIGTGRSPNYYYDRDYLIVLKKPA